MNRRKEDELCDRISILLAASEMPTPVRGDAYGSDVWRRLQPTLPVLKRGRGILSWSVAVVGLAALTIFVSTAEAPSQLPFRARLRAIEISPDLMSTADIMSNPRGERRRDVSLTAPSQNGYSGSLRDLYFTLPDVRERQQIVRWLIDRGDTQTLSRLGELETEPRLKKEILERVRSMKRQPHLEK